MNNLSISYPASKREKEEKVSRWVKFEKYKFEL